MASTKIKSLCPFCGDEKKGYGAFALIEGPGAYVLCTDCFARGPKAETSEQAVANWNKRGS